MIKANYHTHTTRCHHAQGTDESYVEAAIRAGYDVLGFSDHTPWPFRSGYVSRIRMLPDDLRGYIDSVHLLQKQYEGRLTIHLGLEAEYFPRYADWLKRMQDAGISYFILGQHWPDSEEETVYSGRLGQEDDGALVYAESVVRALETGLYSYLCHPDLFLRHRRDDQFSPACEEATAMICQCAVRLGIPLEYNLLGLLEQMSGKECGYPSTAFWKEAREYDPQVIIGVDAHDPAHLLNTDTMNHARAFLSGLGFRVLDRLPMDADCKEE